MKRAFPIFLFFISTVSFAQLQQGFNPVEARDMIAICNSFSYLKMYGSDSEITPNGYVKKYSSEVIGMDNMFQVYVFEGRAVLNFRGSTDQKTSWLENFLSAMIPASGEIIIDGKSHNYTFSNDSLAAVHGGFALAIVFLQEEVITQIKQLNHKGIYDIILTGHSQGAALSQMFRVFLELAKGDQIIKKNTFKTYAFASPKIGNRTFTDEYNNTYCNGWSFSIVNPEDVVPTLPLSYSEERLFTVDNVIEVIFQKDTTDFKGRLFDESIRHYKPMLTTVFNRFGSMVSVEISKDVAKVKMPKYVREINYGVLDELIEIPPVAFPMILKDSTILENDSLLLKQPVDENGVFENKNLYVSEPIFYQHKPYNYYVSVLKLFFPDEYEALEKKWYTKD